MKLCGISGRGFAPGIIDSLFSRMPGTTAKGLGQFGAGAALGGCLCCVVLVADPGGMAFAMFQVHRLRIGPAMGRGGLAGGI